MRKLRMMLLLALVPAALRSAEPPRQRGQTIVVIVARSSPLSDLSRSELRAIYLGQITRWHDRHRIRLFVFPEKSAEQELFLRHVVTMPAIDYGQYWIGEVFRGEAFSPPAVAPTAASMKQH